MKRKMVNRQNKKVLKPAADKLDRPADPAVNAAEGTANVAEVEKTERIRLDRDSRFHNLNLRLYGWINKRFGRLKAGVGAAVLSLVSAGYLYQAFFLNIYENLLADGIFLLILIYSIGYFSIIFNKSCSYCNSKFSLKRTGIFKTGEKQIGSKSYDAIEEEYECSVCGEIEIMPRNIIQG